MNLNNEIMNLKISMLRNVFLYSKILFYFVGNRQLEYHVKLLEEQEKLEQQCLVLQGIVKQLLAKEKMGQDEDAELQKA